MSNLKYNYLLKQIVNPAALRKRLIELNAKYSKNRVHPVIDSWYLPTYQMNLVDDIINCNHYFHGYTTKQLIDGHSGKVRTLHIPEIHDRIYESVIMQVVEPAFKHKWTSIPYASITDRGLSAGLRKVKNYIGCCSKIKKDYALKLDIVKYYESINQDRMCTVIDKHFTNDKIIGNNLKQIVYSFGPGLPIGTYSSQFLANLYLADLDFMCAQLDNDGRCNVVRYMDDIVVICTDYAKVLEMQKAITDWCTNAGLKLHEPVVVNFNDNDDTATIQMCGMQFGHNGVWVAPVTKGHMIQQYSEICQHILDGTCTELDLGRLASIKGWISNSTEWDLLSDMQLDFLIEYLVQDLHGDY